MQNNCIHTFIPLDKHSVLFRSQLKRKEQNRDLELGDAQLLCARMCVYVCECMNVCLLHVMILRKKFHSVCFMLFHSVCAMSPHPSLVQQTVSVFVLEGFNFPWNHKPQLLDFHIILQLLCYFMDCTSMSGTFTYDTRNRIAGVTCTLQREWPIS